MCHVRFSYGSKLFVKTFIVSLRLRLFFSSTSCAHSSMTSTLLVFYVSEKLKLYFRLNWFNFPTEQKINMIWLFSLHMKNCLVLCALTVHMKWWSLILNFGIGIPFLSPNSYKVREKKLHWVCVWVCFCSNEKR